MALKSSQVTLEHALTQRDAEITALRAELAAISAVLPPAVSNPAEFLRQVQYVFSGMLHADPQGIVVWADEAFLERCHCTLTELVGRSLANLLPDIDLDAEIQAAVSENIARQEAFHFEVPDPRPQYERNWLRLKVRPIFDATGQAEMFVCLLEDISLKKRVHLDLMRSEKRFLELAENMPGVLYRWRLTKGGQVVPLYHNPKITNIFGIAVEDGHNFGLYVHSDDQAAWHASIAEAVTNLGPWTFEGRLVVPGQPLRWFRGNSSLSYRDSQGIVYSGIVQDVTPIRMAEETARRTALRKVLAVEGLGDGNWEYNYRSQHLTLSAEFKAMLGYNEEEWPDELIGWTQLVHPDDINTLKRAYKDYEQGITKTFTCEHRLCCQDGNYKWVLSRGLITKRDELNNPLVHSGINTDISVRKKAEAALAVTALRLTTTITKLKGGVLLVDENDKVVLTNNSFCQLFNLTDTPEQLIGTPYALIAAQVDQFTVATVGDAMDMPSLIAARIEIRHDLLNLRNGCLVERDFVPVRDGTTDIGFLWKFEDITESYLAEKSLRLREEKYRTIIDNMQLGLVEIDLEKRVLYANANYCKIIGYTSEELLGNPLPTTTMTQGNPPYVVQQFQQRGQGINSSYDLPIVTKSGETKWLFTGAAPLYDQDQRLTGTIGISLDITHQKELEQSLREAKLFAEQSSRAKELFLANMSHEIRTPMNAILGMSQLLAKTPLASRQSNYLHAITTSAQNLLVIINDILDLSKLDAGKMTIEQVGFNVTRLCAQVEKTLLYKAEEKGLSLVIKLSPRIPDVVLGDPHRIIQILLNLGGNAIKFTPKGEVSIECDVVHFHEGKVEIAFVVRDSGIGIDPVYLKHIFQEFSQEDTSITRQFGGTGLGLSICRSLAKLMDSEIVIESEKNQGTDIHFSLTLPIGTVNDLPQRRAVSEANTQELRGKHVLLVEDNEYNRLMAKTFLINAHIKVTEAENGQVALDCVARQQFDLILMDVQMPVMDGFEATHYLRQTLGLSIPIIALTASAISGEKERCLAAGMDDYLAKPFYEDELLQLVCDWALKPVSLSLAPAPGPAAPVAAAPPIPSSQLYNLAVLLDMGRGDQKFVSSMLQTFINGTRNALRDLHGALAVGNLAGLQATAHKMRPSLRHLQIRPATEIMDTLDNWVGPFSYDDLQPLVEGADQLLRQVLVEMTAELEARHATGI